MSYVKWEQMLKNGGEKALSLSKENPQDYFKESFKGGKWHLLDPEKCLLIYQLLNFLVAKETS